ncbi:non-heme iron oxygenase ferredoxin subunit [Thiorhodococcus minor]|uniref:Non-heme iron oxygenase ferredoxin subunit n=1 Tax=Thiorhodococcus minor TaxID=57489 RepID=A0A6M0K5E6_9GAMM|nr:non-heme iron oxygenase ferredoxin subunit [Thiorhodococcus minor]NEV64153.1 non-heme iron oxygenase ferredoxin subunit [Thiorhodococcus minor]
MSDASFVAVATTDAIPDGKFIKVMAGERPFIIARVNDSFYAVEDNCSHEDYPLSFGCLDGDCIKCSLHGSRFSLVTGDPLDEPADAPIRTYAVKVADGQVWLDPTQPSN